MLTIRREQVRAFQEERSRSFERRLETYLHRVLSADGVSVSSGRIREQIALGMAEAEGYWLVSEGDVASFLEITCRFQGGFPHAEFPKQALANLTAYGLDPAVKLERYRRWAMAHEVR